MMMQRGAESARVALRIALVLANAWPLLPTAAIAKPGPLRASTDDVAPSGLVVVRNVTNSPQQDRALNEQALKNPFISGVAFQIRWRDIEPVQGEPDWSKLDELFAAAESSKKWVQLLIFPGFFAPAWAVEGAKTQLFPIQYGPGKGTGERLPMPWNRVYLDRWFAFLKQLSDRYGKSPAFRVIAADGPTSVSAEMTLPQKPEDLKKWQDDSYTPRKYIEAWQQVFQVYTADFPNQCVSLSVGSGLNINDQGKRDPREGKRTRQTIIDQAVGLLGRRFVLQNSDLSAGPVQHGATSFVIGYSGRMITGLQMRTSAEHESADMGADGDPPLALRRSIDKGMRPNQAGDHINYLEIYAPDVLADEMQPVPSMELRFSRDNAFAEQESTQVSARLALHIALILAGALPSVPTAANAKPGQPRASTDDSAPSGLVVVRHVENSPQQDRALNEQALKNPFISGVGFQIHWSDIEPVEGKPDWSKLDELFAAAESSKKWVQLCIYPGFFAPAWAMEGVKTEKFSVQYGPGKGTVLSLPMPWDSVYLNRWCAFLKQLSDRYGKSPAFGVVAADGPTSVSEEMTLPRDPRKWQNDSYTPRKYVGAWQKVFQVYAADFPNQYVSLAVGNALNINDQGKIAPGEGERTRQTIIDQAMHLLGGRFLLENHDLHAAPKNQQPATSFVMSYSGRVITGLEMRCSAERGSVAMGAEGNPPLALRRSIDKGMRPNQAGHHINYLEIYAPDVLADEMQPVPAVWSFAFRAITLPKTAYARCPDLRLSRCSSTRLRQDELAQKHGRGDRRFYRRRSTAHGYRHGVGEDRIVSAARSGGNIEHDLPCLCDPLSQHLQYFWRMDHGASCPQPAGRARDHSRRARLSSEYRWRYHDVESWCPLVSIRSGGTGLAGLLAGRDLGPADGEAVLEMIATLDGDQGIR